MAERKTGLPVDPTSPLISQIISSLVPMSYQVDRPYSVNTTEVDGGVLYSETPMKVSDPQFAVPPVITGGIEFFKQFMDEPTETASGIATAIGEEIKAYPERQLRTALAGGETYNPETGEVERYDPLGVPATTALGSAASIARTAGDGGTVLGIMAGRNAKDGGKKLNQFLAARDRGLDDQDNYYETQGYVEPSDGAFRFEIDTSNARLKEGRFVDGIDSGDEGPFKRFDFNTFRKQEGRPPKLDEVFDFDELYEQYPELRSIDVQEVPFKNRMGGTKAAFDPVQNIIYIGSAPTKKLVSDILHEVQHAVQHIEGFTPGSSPSNYLPEGLLDKLGDLNVRISKDSGALLESKKGFLNKKTLQERADAAGANIYKYNLAGKARAFFEGKTDDYSYVDFNKFATQDELRELRKIAEKQLESDKMTSDVLKAGRMYRRQPGEVEARTVSKKYEEDRQGEFPLDVQDTPPEDYFYQIDRSMLNKPTAPRVMESRGTGKPVKAEDLGVLGNKNPDTGEFIPHVFYHGTTDSFEDFKVGPSGAVYVSETPGYAEEYAGFTPEIKSERYPDLNRDLSAREGSNIRPVYIKDNLNLFDETNSDHLAALEKAGYDLDEIPENYPNPYDETFRELMQAGEWEVMEEIAPAIKEAGFDGYRTVEGGNYSLAIFDPKNLVSATAKKKEGGVVSLLDIAQNMNRGPKGVASLSSVARNMNRPMVS